jgi:hypothetical protein
MFHLRQHNDLHHIKDYVCVDCAAAPVALTFDLAGYSRHILKKHQSKDNNPTGEQEFHGLSTSFCNQTNEESYNDTVLTEPYSKFCEVNTVLTDEFFASIEEALFIAILELKADPMLSESQLSRSLNVFSRVYKKIIEKYHDVFDLLLYDQNMNKKDELEKIKTRVKLDQLTSVFDEYKSKYKTLKKYEEFDKFVKSETVILGEEEGTRYSKKAKLCQHQQIVKKKTFEYISIKKTLESLFSSDIIRKELKKFDCVAENDGLVPVHYHDSPFWGNINTLRLVLYHDEIEPKNPLSETKCEYKIDMFYFSVLNFTRKHNASLQNIFLNAVIYSKDEKKYNINVVQSKIVEDLSILEKGFTVNGETYYASVAQTSGDNLGTVNFKTTFVFCCINF